MSAANAFNAPTVRFRDPRIAIENTPFIAISQGAKSIDVRLSASNTFSDTQITFQDLSTGGTGMCIDRKIFLDYDYNVRLRVDTAARAVADIVYGTGTAHPVSVAAAAQRGSVRFGTIDFAGREYTPADAQATLLALTAESKVFL